MKISRNKRVAIINEITHSGEVRSATRMQLLNKKKEQRVEWRRKRVEFLVNFACDRLEAERPDQLNLSDEEVYASCTDEAKEQFVSRFKSSYPGSALLTFLLFQLIWYLIKKLLLDD